PLEFMDLGLAAAYATGPLDLVVERRGQPVRVTITPRRAAGSDVQQLGFGHMDQVREVDPGSAAEAAGIRHGDWVVGVAGKPLRSFNDFKAVIRDNAGKPLA